MEKYDDFAVASKENLENLSREYNNSLKVDALNTGDGLENSASTGNESNRSAPNSKNGSLLVSPKQDDTTIPATPVKKNNKLAQFNILLLVMMLSLINGNTYIGT